MPLPPPGGGTFWKEYEIATPTFQLTPIEKPDMSPYLVHMTGKNSILSILKCEGATGGSVAGHGFLKAATPEYSEAGYDAKVVCFSESPTFALDFFRYRSFKRWNADQRFGIGFDKSALVAKGVRPVLYVDRQLLGRVTTLRNSFRIKVMGLSELLAAMYPLLFPLLEDNPSEGFMWEREWRHTNPDGFLFDHAEIRVICCPLNEEAAMKTLLGPHSDSIVFIRAWKEYDEVTNFLQTRQPIWQAKQTAVSGTASKDEKIAQLSSLVQQYQIALHSLDAYKDLIRHLKEKEDRVQQEQQAISGQVAQLQDEIDTLKKQEDDTENEQPVSDDEVPF